MSDVAVVEAGFARYTYRLRVSATAERLLSREWDAVRWVWNRCVAESKATHLHNRTHPDDVRTCGAAQLDKQLTGWRAQRTWLGRGASVPPDEQAA